MLIGRLSVLLSAIILMYCVTAWANRLPAPPPLVEPAPKKPIPKKSAQDILVESAEPVLKLAPIPAAHGNKAQLVIEARDDVNESFLVIPARLVEKPAEKNVNAPGAAAPAQPGQVRLALAGLALSAAMGFGGLWLARRGGIGSSVTKLAVAGAVLVGLGGTLAAWADVLPEPVPGQPAPRPPRRPQPVPAPAPIPVAPVPLPAVVTLSGPVIVQVDPQATDVKLVVNRKMLAKLAEDGDKIPVAPPPPGGNNGGGLIPVAPPPVLPPPMVAPLPAPIRPEANTPR